MQHPYDEDTIVTIPANSIGLMAQFVLRDKLGRVVWVNHHPGQWPEYVYYVIFPGVDKEPIIFNSYNIIAVERPVYCVGAVEEPSEHDPMFWGYLDAVDYINSQPPSLPERALGIWAYDPNKAPELITIHFGGHWFPAEGENNVRLR